MTTIYDFPFPGASPTGIDFGAFLLSHGGRCAPTVGYSPEASNGLLLICSLTMSITITQPGAANMKALAFEQG